MYLQCFLGFTGFSGCVRCRAVVKFSTPGSVATISYYPIRNGWEMWYGKNGLFYYKTIQDCRSYDLQNLGLKIHNFSLELKQSKTPPAASCWIISTLVRRYVFFNPRFCKSWDCPNPVWLYNRSNHIVLSNT